MTTHPHKEGKGAATRDGARGRGISPRDYEIKSADTDKGFGCDQEIDVTALPSLDNIPGDPGTP